MAEASAICNRYTSSSDLWRDSQPAPIGREKPIGSASSNNRTPGDADGAGGDERKKGSRTQKPAPRSQGAGIFYIPKRNRAKITRAATRSLIAQAGGIHLLKSIPAIIQTEPADTPRANKAARTCGTGGGRKESIPTTPKRTTCGRHCRRYHHRQPTRSHRGSYRPDRGSSDTTHYQPTHSRSSTA